MTIQSGDNGKKEASAYRKGVRSRTGTLGGSNRMLSAREVAAILSVPESSPSVSRAWPLACGLSCLPRRLLPS